MLLPTIGIAGWALWNAGQSYRDASTRQLLETAEIVSRSVRNEIDITARVTRSTGSVAAGTTGLYQVRQRKVEAAEGTPVSQAIRSIVMATAQSGRPAVSNILPTGSGRDVGLPMLALAAPQSPSGDGDRVIVIQAPANAMIHALSAAKPRQAAVILAVTDGTGRIINRSVDGERLVGRPVPDWKTLVAMGRDQGWFRARRIDGGEIVFGFTRIPGTPGWVAVVGEPAAAVDARWLHPLVVTVIACGIALVVALVLAFLLAHWVLRPISHLARRARAVARNQGQVGAIGTAVPPSFVSEFEVLRISLDDAEQALRNSLAESRNAERVALKNAEALRQAERIARIGSWTLDLRTNAFSQSDMLHELNGTDPVGPPVTVDHLVAMFSESDFQRLSAAISECAATGEPYSLEAPHKRADGQGFIAFIQGRAIRDDDGEIVALAGTVQDISEQAEQRGRLTALADNLPNGAIFRLEENPDRSVRIAYVSAGIERVGGLRAVDVVKHSGLLLDRIPPEDRAELMRKLEQSRRDGGVLDHQFRLAMKNEQQIWVHARAAVRILPHGEAVWDGISRDVTVEREVEQTLQRAKEAAEKAERAKADFLATMSHEIRTPMNTVIGMSRLMLQSDLSSRQRNYVEKISSAAGVLLSIINDVLDFSKIEAGALALERIEFTIEEVLESVSAITALKAEEKGLELSFAVDADVPSTLEGDPMRLGQVLINLVGNAVKFTERGDVVVAIRRARSDKPATGVMLEFAVRDTGIGLTRDQIDGLFQPFTQADGDTSRKYGGTGLGLAICKRLVELMGGQIWVESKPGEGSTFFFTADMGLVSGHRNMMVAQADLGGFRVLVCDDNQSARDILSDMVLAFGAQTRTATGGHEALAMLRAAAQAGEAFDLVLLDWRMPGIDGLEAARLIKNDTQLETVPAVLMVTAYGHELVARGVSEIGLQGMLLKPVTQSMLLNTLQGVLLGSSAPDEGRSGRKIRKAQYHPSYEKLAGRRILVVDDNALNREVAVDFLALVGAKADTAVDGLEAIRRMEGVDYDAVLMDVHMPEMDGLEAVAAIRKRPEWATLPVIALTAQTRPEDQRASLAAGMSGHLTKPIDENMMYATLLAVLGLDAPRAPVRDRRRALPEDEQDSIDVAALLDRFGNNVPRVVQLMRGVRDDFHDAPQRLDAMMRAGQSEKAANLVHRIKGVVGYFGAHGLSESASRLEHALRGGDLATAEFETGQVGKRLEAFLPALDEAIDHLSDAGETREEEPIEGGTLLPRIDAIAALIKAGDFAAKNELERLREQLHRTPFTRLIDDAERHFDDLDLEEAVAALLQLRSLIGTGTPQ